MTDSVVENPANPKWMVWTGRVLSALPVPLFVFSASMKLRNPPDLAEGFAHLGWPISVGVPLGVVELVCTILYAIPQTAVLGAVLLTGYLGGAIATHVRIGEPIFMHVGLGIVLWLGLFLRDARIRSLLPWRTLP
jgi:hypothetical protein